MINGSSFTLKLLMQISVLVYGKCNPSEAVQIRPEVPVPLPGRWLQREGCWFTKENVLPLEVAL